MSWHWSSNGNTNSRKLDHWLDPNETGVNFVDGMDYTSALTNPNAQNISLQLYPNPTNDVINITLDQTTIINQIDIFDQAGRKVETYSNASPIYTLSLKHLQKGVYTIKVITDETTFTQQIILN